MITRIKNKKTEWNTFKSLTGLDLSSHLLMRAGISKWSAAKNAFFFFYPTCTCRRFPLKQLCSRSEWQKKRRCDQHSSFSIHDRRIHSKENQEQHKQTLLTMWYLPLPTAEHDFHVFYWTVRCRQAMRELVLLNTGHKLWQSTSLWVTTQRHERVLRNNSKMWHLIL